MDISLDLVIEAARRRLAAITPESAGYIVLLATQQLIAHPCRVLPADLLLQEHGEVLVRALPRASEREVEAALRTLLATLLSLSPSPVPAISAVVERDASLGLPALASELSGALIPINHAAARRALARLYRETRRAGGLGVEVAPVPPSPLAVAPLAVAPLAATDSAVPSASAAEPPRSAPALAPAPESEPASLVASEAWAELDIDVEIEREVAAAERVPALPVPPACELRESGLASSAPPAPQPAVPLEAIEASPASARAETGVAACRSNIRELLGSYLSHTRAEEPMTRALREMIGLAAPPSNSDAPPSLRDAVAVSR